ncbi:hypothetical protein D5F11_021450 [Siminovitchia terrae]|uniref:Uncharacterized protein n=1 Tax=Siminovitchia terrae TaxID=1914933 RepID=A0A429X2A4_SIMTE|nr:hypothetical protein [Siminovitchia terrae]RST57629.1 hypothetical protein D5F11_021450 [Siminovitchia terrae]
MKKITLALAFSLLLIGCASASESAKTPITDASSEEKNEGMSEDSILLYMELITGKYLTVDMYEKDSTRQLEVITKALLDVDSAVSEIEEEYPDDQAAKELLKLADAVEVALNKLLIGEHATKGSYSEKTGEIIGDISRTYLDGELPPSVRIHTGVENANN